MVHFTYIRFILYLSCGFCMSVSALSLNHVLGLVDNVDISAKLIGLLGWLTLLSVFLVLFRRNFKQLILLWLLFFGVGLIFGPYLEPPSDPIFHLERIQENHFQTTTDIPKQNEGLWHYSMVSVVICNDIWPTHSAEMYLLRIYVAHAIIVSCMLTCIFWLSQRVGLRGRWAFFSTIFALLFMGTNRFSFFSYYTFSPSALSLILYWIWIGFFFMTKSKGNTLKGLCVAIILLPILWSNHIQEAVFLLYLVFFWIILNICVSVYSCAFLEMSKRRDIACLIPLKMRSWVRYITLPFLFLLLYVVPQFSIVTDWFSTGLNNFGEIGHVNFSKYWLENQFLVHEWNGIYLGGRIQGGRVEETLGIIHIVILFCGIVCFVPGILRIKFETKMKIYLLSILPIIYYFTPLFHYFWTANVYPGAYYRLCYASLFWLFFSFVLKALEARLYLFVLYLRNLRKIKFSL